ncbi:hypothetical protein CRG98_007578 [Punica granatum]|uniref:Uncharacterized protein n=1 Tax=Punica granatum TaxID=22663 RepID=A0A2I0KU90_PUNGR|nr:hypothetical protein CRG98_007578 [Punica granatum]
MVCLVTHCTRGRIHLGGLNCVEEPIGDRVGVDNQIISLGDSWFAHCGLFCAPCLCLKLLDFAYRSRFGVLHHVETCCELLTQSHFVRADFLGSLTYVHLEAELRVICPWGTSWSNPFPIEVKCEGPDRVLEEAWTRASLFACDRCVPVKDDRDDDVLGDYTVKYAVRNARWAHEKILVVQRDPWDVARGGHSILGV